jgi:DNA-binding Lrp family transcriptional regulator
MKEMILKTVSLTPRDLLLLQGLYDFTVMSFTQINRMFFNGLSNSTISNRLSKLEKGGMVKSYRVPKFSGSVDKPAVSVLFQITKNGIRELQKRNFAQVLRDEPTRLHGHSIEHDVILSDVLEALSKRVPDTKLVHGKLVSGEGVASGLNPDAILVLPDGKTKWAIELELTLKAEYRYREIVTRYRLASSIARVIYVTGHPAIREKLIQVLGVVPTSQGAKASTGKFFFIGLDELFNESKDATINNGKEILTRSEVCL